MRLEEERVKDIRVAAMRRREAEEAERRDAARRIEEAERAQRVAEEDRARAEHERAREEGARHRAMEAAAVEQERLVTQARIRAEELEMVRHHELAMERLRRDAEKVQLKRLLALVSLAAGALVLVGALLYGLQLKPAADRAFAQAVADVAARDAMLRDARGRLEITERDAQKAAVDVDAARREIMRVRTELAELRKTCQPRGGGGRPHGPPSAPTRADPPCNPRDPMCFDLPK